MIEDYELELFQFVSSINRKYEDTITRASWNAAERTMYLWVSETKQNQIPVPAHFNSETDQTYNEPAVLINCVRRPKQLCIYFPEDPKEKPFCYCFDDELLQTVEAINNGLLPLASTSVYHASTVVIKAFQSKSLPSTYSSCQLRPILEAEICEALKDNLRGIDLCLTLFAISMQSNKRISIAKPNPFNTLFGDSWIANSRLNLEDFEPLKNYSKQPAKLCSLSAENIALLWFICFGQPAKLRFKHKDDDLRCICMQVELPENPWFDYQATKHGTVETFHGSESENIHSILNRGLQNMTDSRKMKNGALFGDGVYLAGDQQVALTFAGGAVRAWSSSLFAATSTSEVFKESSRGWFCHRIVLCCDIINRPEYLVKSWKNNNSNIYNATEYKGSYFVVKNEADIRIKKIFLFSLEHLNEKQQQQKNISTSKSKQKEPSTLLFSLSAHVPLSLIVLLGLPVVVIVVWHIFQKL